MPGRDFYVGRGLPDALRMMAEHHASEETRHISTFEYELLHQAADVLEDAGTEAVIGIDEDESV